ncbi:MAG: hypothetical protein AVDCRST_MAG11-118, partial [uncultured Gemmatimonadaceae bacterium]
APVKRSTRPPRASTVGRARARHGRSRTTLPAVRRDGAGRGRRPLEGAVPPGGQGHRRVRPRARGAGGNPGQPRARRDRRGARAALRGPRAVRAGRAHGRGDCVRAPRADPVGEAARRSTERRV